MPKEKLTAKQRKEIQRALGNGATMKEVAQAYGVSVTYCRALFNKSQFVRIDSNAEPFIGVPQVSLRNPKAYRIGFYKNGHPILAYVGQKVEPIITFNSNNRIIIGKTANNAPVYAYIGQAALTALENYEAGTGISNFALAPEEHTVEPEIERLKDDTEDDFSDLIEE